MMAMKRAETWNKPVMRALSMQVGICENDRLLGVDLCAADGSTFGHGHLDLENAEQFLSQFTKCIEYLRTKQMQSVEVKGHA
jgi:hypothetical protein